MKSVTHNGLVCEFHRHGHIYMVASTGQRLTSGTQFVKQFFPKFDAIAISERIADERGTTPEALRREWAETGLKASTEGTAIHAYCEYLALGRGDAPLSINQNDRMHKLKKQAKRMFAKFAAVGLKIIDAERIIFSPGLGLAGQVDLLLHNKQNEIIILDYKIIKELKKENPFEQGFFPLDLMDNCNWIHYSLQLSLYQYLLEIENCFQYGKGFKRIIAHITEDEVVLHRPPDMRNFIEEMLI